MKEERIELQPETENPCWIDSVKSGKVVVGFAPTRVTSDLDEDLEAYGPEKCHELIISQIRTNHKNTVRAKTTSSKLKANEVIDLVVAGDLSGTKIKDFADIHKMDFTTAANQIIQEDSDPEKIHWDVL